MPHMLRSLRLLFAGGSLVLLVGCPGTLENPQRFLMMDAGDSCDPEGLTHPDAGLFKLKCGGSGCHESPAPANNLDLVAPGAGERIATGKATGCMMLPLQSYTLNKVKAAPMCGSQMPLGADPLTADELKCLEDYLARLGGDGGT